MTRAESRTPASTDDAVAVRGGRTRRAVGADPRVESPLSTAPAGRGVDE